ncbi:MAG: PDK1 family serine/threonine-protein kinase [archaeon]|nr:PDK1 family serine/threonine-protein kinase [archaeon]
MSSTEELDEARKSALEARISSLRVKVKAKRLKDRCDSPDSESLEPSEPGSSETINEGVENEACSSADARQDGAAAPAVETSSDSEPALADLLPKSLDDLTIGRTLGEGAFAVVKEAFSFGRVYALKILDKKLVISQNELTNVFREKTILQKMSHPGIVQLHMTAMDDRSLYFLLEYCANGELFDLIKKYGRFSENVAKFYTAEILEALEHIHSHGIVHRDMKPENILLDQNWHIKITDFGTAKEIGATVRPELVRSSFVGTSHYLSPEILNEDKVSTSSDIWALGCIVYQMLVGKPPFQGPTDYIIFEQIRENRIVFPDFVSQEARQLISAMLRLQSSERPTPAQIRESPWLSSVKFDQLWSQTSPQINLLPGVVLSGSPASTPPSSPLPPLFSGFDQIPTPTRHISVPISTEHEHAHSFPSSSSPNKRGASNSAPPSHNPDKSSDPTSCRSPMRPQHQHVGTEPSMALRPANSPPTDFHLAPPPAESTPWDKYLRGDELVVFHGTIEKRTGLIFRTRSLFLVAGQESRLFYTDPISNELKGELDLKDIVSVKVKKDNKKFQIVTPWRIYNLAARESTAAEWKSHIALLSDHNKRASSHEAIIQKESQAFDILLGSSPP